MIGTDIQLAIKLLQQGKVIGMPTETVYGLAGNALNEEAVIKIFKVKNRPRFNPLIIHLPDITAIESYAKWPTSTARTLAETFMPGPITLLLPKLPAIADLVTAGSQRVAIRVPAHPLANELLRGLSFPLAAPSANPSGYVSPTTAQHVARQLGEHIPYILDGGPCEVGLESTIVGFEAGQTVIYRKGGIALEELEKVAGPLSVQSHSSSNPESPGQLAQHYSPKLPIVVGHLPTLIHNHRQEDIAVLSFQEQFPEIPEHRQFILSSSGSLDEAARNLFRGLRQMDQTDATLLLAEWLPERGLGRAINDRLRRASAKK